MSAYEGGKELPPPSYSEAMTDPKYQVQSGIVSPSQGATPYLAPSAPTIPGPQGNSQQPYASHPSYPAQVAGYQTASPGVHTVPAGYQAVPVAYPGQPAGYQAGTCAQQPCMTYNAYQGSVQSSQVPPGFSTTPLAYSSNQFRDKFQTRKICVFVFFMFVIVAIVITIVVFMGFMS